MMQFTTPTARYLVKSHGNGWAYEITDQATGETIWAQDEDAAQLQTYTGDFENESAISQFFDCFE